MGQTSKIKTFYMIFLLILFSLTVTTYGFSSDKQLTEIFGTVQVINGKKITLINNDDGNEVTIFSDNTEGLKIKDFVRIICYAISDSGDIFVATELENLQSN